MKVILLCGGFERKWPPKGMALLGGVTVLEEVCNGGHKLFCLIHAQAMPRETVYFLLPAY